MPMNGLIPTEVAPMPAIGPMCHFFVFGSAWMVIVWVRG